MGETAQKKALVRRKSRLGLAGLVLSLAVFLGTIDSIAVLVAIASPYAGAAIDNEDGQILRAAEVATLQGAATASVWCS
ncbi:hypothetical protein ACEXOS_015205 [Herbiconiux sp. P16]|uniref:hypothetical protein n=1 Tax=Herbiconiux wuyangfengii TaxID=3342794 RepID=UPI0035B88219